MDQAGELFNNPEIKNLFAKSGCTIHPIGADASCQNDRAEGAHCAVTDAIQALLTSANMSMKFWPCAFHHALQIHDALPTCANPTESPITEATDVVKDFTHFRTFGCRAWVFPPGKRTAKLKPNSCRSTFLGCVLNATQNILWCNPEIPRVKIATHVCFDKGFNDLLVTDVPPDVVHLQRTDDNNPTPIDNHDMDTLMLNFCITPFTHLEHFTVKSLVLNINTLDSSALMMNHSTSPTSKMCPQTQTPLALP